MIRPRATRPKYLALAHMERVCVVQLYTATCLRRLTEASDRSDTRPALGFVWARSILKRPRHGQLARSQRGGLPSRDQAEPPSALLGRGTVALRECNRCPQSGHPASVDSICPHNSTNACKSALNWADERALRFSFCRAKRKRGARKRKQTFLGEE